jgi:hypothetical protein
MPIAMPPPDEVAGPGADPAAAPSVSRERSRIMAPPRSAVPVPGAGRAFGRGFLGRLRQEPAGCFLLFFCFIGVALASFGVAGTFGPYRDSLRQNGDPRFFYAAMAFGAVFFLVALRMLQVMLTGVGNAIRRQAARGPRDRPWEWDYPWRPRGMRPDYTSDPGGTLLGRVAFFALLGLFNIAWGSPSWLLKGIVALFDVLGLLMLYDTLVLVVNWLRFRQPEVAWTTFPAHLGGELAATVRFPRALRPAGAVKATLRCVRDEWTERRAQAGERRELEPYACYAETREIPLPGAPGEPAGTGSRLRRLDVHFAVPADLPGTDLQKEESVYWQLLVQVPLAGPDYQTVFLAPVYRRG